MINLKQFQDSLMLKDSSSSSILESFEKSGLEKPKDQLEAAAEIAQALKQGNTKHLQLVKRYRPEGNDSGLFYHFKSGKLTQYPADGLTANVLNFNKELELMRAGNLADTPEDDIVLAVFNAARRNRVIPTASTLETVKYIHDSLKKGVDIEKITENFTQKRNDDGSIVLSELDEF